MKRRPMHGRHRGRPGPLAAVVMFAGSGLAPLVVSMPASARPTEKPEFSAGQTSAHASTPAHASAPKGSPAKTSATSASDAKTTGKSSSAAKKSSHSAKSKKTAAKARGQKVPTPERISEIQSALARGGYYSGDPNGKFDGGTQEALKKFQESNSISPSGKLDALTLQKLGLGSPTAGVAPPRPSVPPASASSDPSHL